MQDNKEVLSDLFWEFKCLLKTMDNVIDFCSDEYGEIYYLYVLYKIIMKKADLIEEIIEKMI